MNTINPSNQINMQATPQELEKRVQSQENFGAIDSEKLKQDAVELSKKAHNEAKENFIFRILRDTFGVKDPKKFLTSVGLTLATVVGGAVLGNKLAIPTAKLGLKVDEAVANSKMYKAFKKGSDKTKNSVVNFLKKSGTISDIMETFQNRRAKAKATFARGYGQGFKNIFRLTPPDTAQKAVKKICSLDVNKGKKPIDAVSDSLKKLVDDKDTLDKLTKSMTGQETLDNAEFCKLLSGAMRKKFGCKTNREFLDVLEKLQKNSLDGVDVSEFINVDMVEKGLGGITNSWWPVNIINSLGKKIRGDKWKPFGRGNLFDALIKQNVVCGELAETKIGSLVQQCTTVPLESITNFVNDKSGMGAFLCASIMSLYNNVQDAPKEMRVATVADDYVGTIGSIAISTPIASAIVYGLASMKNLKGDTFLSKVLKLGGNFFGMGLDRYDKNLNLKPYSRNWKTFAPRYLGGALRFATIMFVFAPMFSKPIQGVIHKIFGKPYNKAEEDQKKQLEAQKNQVIPELGITQGELVEKIQKNPQAIQKLQTDQKLAIAASKDPKLLLDLLEGKEVKIPEEKPTPASRGVVLSPANKKILGANTANAVANDTNMVSKTPKQKAFKQENTQQNKNADTATYIPSSEFVATSNLSPEQKQELDAIIAKSDKILAKAEKYI